MWISEPQIGLVALRHTLEDSLSILQEQTITPARGHPVLAGLAGLQLTMLPRGGVSSKAALFVLTGTHVMRFRRSLYLGNT